MSCFRFRGGLDLVSNGDLHSLIGCLVLRTFCRHVISHSAIALDKLLWPNWKVAIFCVHTRFFKYRKLTMKYLAMSHVLDVELNQVTKCWSRFVSASKVNLLGNPGCDETTGQATNKAPIISGISKCLKAQVMLLACRCLYNVVDILPQPKDF